MASNKLLVILSIVAVTLPTAAMASEFWVGGASGWTIGYDYQAWAKDKVFKVGDTLVFNYTEGKHNVIEANKTAFDSCIIPSENEALLASGHDVITLATPGEKWYICGVANHCSELNQKLAITVEGGDLAPASAPARALAPPPPPPPAPAPNTSNSGAFLIIVVGLLVFIVFPIYVIRKLCKPRTLIPVRLLVEV